ncbi:MAG: uracil-DNA glycosylase [Bdellovibrionia bacterium]
MKPSRSPSSPLLSPVRLSSLFRSQLWRGYLPKNPILMARKRPPTPPSKPWNSLEELKNDLLTCQRCTMCTARKHALFGQGSTQARLMVLTSPSPPSSPSQEQPGQPLSQESSELFNRMLSAIGLKREEIFLTPLVKCQTNPDRMPQREEILTCLEHFEAELRLVQPSVVVTLGEQATSQFIPSHLPFSETRGKFYSYSSVKILPTHHPDFLIAHPHAKKESWMDLKRVAAELNLTLPSSSSR